MKKNNIKKMAVTLATLQALSMTGCKSNNVDVIDHNSITQILSFSDTIVDSEGYKHPTKVDLYKKNYTQVPSDRNIYDINYAIRIYDKKGKDIGEIKDYLRVTALETNGEYTLIQIDNKEYYVEADRLMEVPQINKGDYKIITDNKEVICDDWIYIYDNTGKFLGSEWGNIEATAVATNGEYTLVTFQDGSNGFVESSKLNPKYVHKETYAYVRAGTPMYSDKELTKIVGYEPNDHITYVHLDDGNCAYIGNEYYKEVYYVNSNLLEYTEDFNYLNVHAYICTNIPLYSSKELTGQIDILDPYSVLTIYEESINGDWVSVYDCNHNINGFIRKGNYIVLDEDFIDIDLGNQTIYLYEDNRFSQKGYIRSGRDTSPTHVGIFDIDGKYENFEFTRYPGCYAKHWMPYNEYEEGIHDLVGDDEDYYGNGAYHDYGSHGCVRVKRNMSQYIYDNFDVGTKVLVHK